MLNNWCFGNPNDHTQMNIYTILWVLWFIGELITIIYLYSKSIQKQKKIVMFDYTSPNDKTYSILSIRII